MKSGMAAVRHYVRVRALEEEYARLLETISPRNPIRMVTKIRQMILIRGTDSMPYEGIPHCIKWKNLGSGIWEARLEEVR